MDTGSSISLISTATLNRFKINPEITASTIRIVGITGSMAVVGETWLEMTVGATKLSHLFTVVNTPNFPGTALIGHPFLVETGIWLHPASNTIIFKNESLKLSQGSAIWGQPRIHKPTCKEYVANSCQDVRVSDSKEFPAKSYADCLKGQHPNGITLDTKRAANSAHGSRDVCHNITQEREQKNPDQNTSSRHGRVANLGPIGPKTRGDVTNTLALKNRFASLDPDENLGTSASCEGSVTKVTKFHGMPPDRVNAGPATTSPSKRASSRQRVGSRETNASPQPPTALPADPATNEALPASPKSSWHKHSKFVFWVDKQVSIPPFSGKDIKVKCREAQGYAVVHPLYTTHKCMTTFPGLHEISNHRSTVILLNTTPAEITLYPGNSVLNFEYLNGTLDIKEPPTDVICASVANREGSGNFNLSGTITSALEAVPTAFPETTDQLIRLFLKYPALVPTPDRPIGQTSLLEHSITLQPDAKPVRIPAYKVPHARRVQLEKEIEGMLDMGIIEHSKSPWNSPLLLVPKADGSFRPVVDFRALNKLTIAEPFPCPSIKRLLSDINNKAVIFSTIDLQKGFLQVPLEENSRPLTAFSSSKGHYQFKVAPMGLMNSPLTFARLMNLLMQDLMGDECLVYLDDLLIASPTVEDHFVKLEQVFDRLQTSGLTVNLAKCKFFQKSLTFLGHTISEKGIQPNNLKIQSVIDFPTPTNPKQIKQLLGLAGFYRGFIRHYGTTSAPLTALLKKDAKFVWGPEQQAAFDKLKADITNTPVLAFPDYGRAFHLFTDASSIGLGAVLMQKSGRAYKPIAFASRLLNETEKKYSATDRECLGAVWSLRHFREIILGYQIFLYTDHSALTSLNSLNSKDPHNRRARYIMTLSDYNVTLKYIKGILNTPPDALSRMVTEGCNTPYDLEGKNPSDFPPSYARPCATTSTTEEEPYALHKDDIISGINEDPIFSSIHSALLKGKPAPSVKGYPTKRFILIDGLLYHKYVPPRIKGRKMKTTITLVIPPRLINNILRLTHNNMFHAGVAKTERAIRKKYYIHKLHPKVLEYIGTCKRCPLFKGTTGPATAESYAIPKRPWERVFSDILTLPTSMLGNKYLITFIDQLTRFAEIRVIPDKTAATIARTFFESVISRHGTPSSLITDNDPAYNSDIMANLCKLMKVNKPNILTYRPEANGFAERLNKSILDLLRSLPSMDRNNWCTFIPAVQGAINGTYHTSLGNTPDFILYGFDKRMPFDLLHGQELPLYSDRVEHTLVRDAQASWRKVRDVLISKRDKNLDKAAHTPGHKIKKNDLVYHKKVPRGLIRQKLSDAFEGPFRVIGINRNKITCLNLNSSLEQDISTFHADTLKTAREVHP